MMFYLNHDLLKFLPIVSETKWYHCPHYMMVSMFHLPQVISFTMFHLPQCSIFHKHLGLANVCVQPRLLAGDNPAKATFPQRLS